VALRHARVGTRRALGNARAGRFCEGPHDGLPDGCVTHKLRAHEHPRLAFNGVIPRLVLGHLHVLRVRLLSIVYCKKTSAARGNTKRTPPRTRRGQLAGTRYPREAIRGTGLGRGDPSADGASGFRNLRSRSTYRVFSLTAVWSRPSVG